MSGVGTARLMTGPLLATPSRIRARLRRAGVRSHLLGLLLRVKLPRSGVLLVMGGWHLPEIDDRGGRIDVGSCAFFPGVRLECWKDAHIRIGSGTYLNRNTEIVAAKSVALGRDCKIGRDVLIMDTDQHPVPGQPFVPAPVAIEDRVWIGARAMILKGVTIGHDSIIGAGAIVTRDVPPLSVAVGQPARVIRQIGSGESKDGP
jgi:acetyltransferase-like isoleucine patch superfamily enzyme